MKNKNLFSDIVVKLKELEAMNEIEPTYGSFGKVSDDPNNFDNIMERQETLMDELKTIARAHNTLLGRTVRFPHADSYAVYVVTKVNKTSVRLTWVKFCDAWQDDRIGYEANIDINYVSQKIKGEDALEEMFARNREAQLKKQMA
jgi:hypothetical protein